MKKTKIGTALWGLLAFFLVFLLVYCLWPRNLEKILSLKKEEALDGITIYAVDFGQSSPTGEPDLRAYELEIEGGKESEEILSFLGRMKVYGDPRNLLPWPVESVTSSGENIPFSFSMQIRRGEEKSILNFHGDSILAVQKETGSEFQIYHLWNKGLLEDLFLYAAAHGNTIE